MMKLQFSPQAEHYSNQIVYNQISSTCAANLPQTKNTEILATITKYKGAMKNATKKEYYLNNLLYNNINLANLGCIFTQSESK